jgi:nickel transport system permease protein
VVGAVLERDYFMVQATVLIYAVIVILINFMAEIVHAWLDPRVRLD